MPRFLFCGLLVVIGFSLGQIGPISAERADPVETLISDPKLKFEARQPKNLHKLAKEHVAAARGMLWSHWELFEGGMTGKSQSLTAIVSALVTSSRELLDAEMELASTEQERIAALEKHWLIAKAAEKLIDRNFKAGRLSPQEMYWVRSWRLGAEIRLAKARQAK
jgi:hypothetical protein